MLQEGRYPMWLVQRALLAAALSLASSQIAAAACSSAGCPDPASIEAVRGRVAASCECAASGGHGKYVHCAARVIKAAVKDGSLSKKCRKAVLQCEQQSTCGIAGAMVCCERSGKGRVKAKVMKGRNKCKGTACTGQAHAADACT